MSVRKLITSSVRMIMMLVVMVGLAVGIGTSTADAAPGVRGGFTSVSVKRIDYSCFPESPQYCYTTSLVSVRGWAYNGRTKPSQDVQIKVTGTLRYAYKKSTLKGKFYSGAHRANRKDVADQRKHGLSTSKVGFGFTSKNPTRDYYYSGKVKVCLRVRDHGTNQIWRTVQCKTVTAH